MSRLDCLWNKSVVQFWSATQFSQPLRRHVSTTIKANITFVRCPFTRLTKYINFIARNLRLASFLSSIISEFAWRKYIYSLRAGSLRSSTSAATRILARITHQVSLLAGYVTHEGKSLAANRRTEPPLNFAQNTWIIGPSFACCSSFNKRPLNENFKYFI